MVSIIIPTYEMHGRGVEMLHNLIKSIAIQMVDEPCEIIISDNSHNNDISDYINTCQSDYITYVRNPGDESNAASNFNNAIKHAKGDIIKPMCLDDYFIEADTIQKLQNIKTWAVCKSSDHIPYVNKSLSRLREGENTYGSPSAVAWRKNELLFDENLLWLMDCDMWARMQEHYGEPEFIDTTVGIRKWEGQLTYSLSNRRIIDLEYVQNKYK